MEKIADALSEKIAVFLNFEESKKAVITYGLISLANTLVIMFFVLILGILLKILFESLIILIGVGLLKKSTGGAHSNTMLGCIIVSVSSITLFALLSKYTLNIPISIYLNISISALLYAVSLTFFIKLVPVETKNKPIKNPDKIKKLRRQSLTLLNIYSFLSVLFIVIPNPNSTLCSTVNCIRFVILWQTFMLTKYGFRFSKLIRI